MNRAALRYRINLTTLSVKPSPIDTKRVGNHKLVRKTVVVCNSKVINKVINDTKVEDKVKAKLREMGQRAGPRPHGDTWDENMYQEKKNPLW